MVAFITPLKYLEGGIIIRFMKRKQRIFELGRDG
jgi:hypothetical protein